MIGLSLTICRTFRFAALAAAFLCLCAVAEAQSVRLKAKVTVKNSQVRLGDIAWCSSLGEKAEKSVVATICESASAVCVDISNIENLLRKLNINPAKVQFSGSAACLITLKDQAGNSTTEKFARRSVSEIAADGSGEITTIGDYIIDSVARAMHKPAGKVDVKFSRGSTPLAKESLDEVVEITCENAEISQGQCRWRVELLRSGRRVQRWISGSVCVIKKGVVTTSTLKAGQPITSADVRIGDVADDGSVEYYEKLSEVVGLELRRSLPSGMAIEIDNVNSPVLVRAGRQIRVSCGVVNITAESRDSGKLGDVIRVENSRSGRSFNAIVTGPSTAKIQLANNTEGEI